MSNVDPAAAALQAAIAALPPVTILNADIPKEVLEKCIELSKTALCQSKVEKDIATYIKTNLELYNGALWHVIVGQSFGCSVCSEVKSLALFKFGKTNILCFSSFDESSLVNGGDKKVVRAVQKKEEEEEPAAE